MYVYNMIFFISLLYLTVNSIRAKESERGVRKSDGNSESKSKNEVIDFQKIDIETKISNVFNNLFHDLEKIRKDISIDKTITFPYEEIFFSRQNRYEMETDFEKMNRDTVNNLFHNLKRNQSLSDNDATTSMYNKAVSILNTNHSNKKEAYSILINASMMGNNQAKADVAWALICGTHLPQNITMAKTLFEQLAEDGHPEGHTGMGFLHSTGLLVNVSQARAVLHYTIGALGGSHWARMALGFRYLFGISVSANCEKALHFYRQVASHVASSVEANGGAVVYRIKLMDEEDDPAYQSGLIDRHLLDYYEMLADKGDVSAQLGLAHMYYRGARGLPKDYKKALQYFSLAAAAGNPVALAFMGKIYLEGDENVNVDLMNAYLSFRKSADQGNAIGQYGLGLMYMEGKYVEKNMMKALSFLSQSASQGWVESLLVMGTMYLQGKVLRRDYSVARKYFIMASQVGHVLGYYNLAQMHSSGIGTMRSCTTAVELFKHVAERARWGKQLMDAYRHYKSHRFNEAFVIYALFAEMGFETGQSNAAFLLDKGLFTFGEEGQHGSYYRARSYWGNSALQGSPQSLIKLGDYAYYGQGTTVDYVAALNYYRLAWEGYRSPRATFNLGYMHEHGLGVQQDLHLAKRCYDAAAEASPDAEFPVLLALLKLQLTATAVRLMKTDWAQVLALRTLNQYFGRYWDIYFSAFLLFCVAYILHFRMNHRDLIRDIMNFL